jgi:hypothetical protein
MIDKEKPLNLVVGKVERSDPVYAVNKAGDFSKKSVREPEWPQNAEEKQPLSEINENKSKGAMRFQDAIKRVIQLGELPKGMPLYAITSSGSESDNAMGIVPLPKSDLQEHQAERMKAVDAALAQSQNSPQSFEWVKSRAKMTDKYDTGSNKNVSGRDHGIPVVDSIPLAGSSDGKDVLKVDVKKNIELKVL